MQQEEVLNLFALYTAAYPLSELNKEQIALWINMLADLPYNNGLKNIEFHIRTNRFPPTIADVMRVEENQTVHEQLRLETVSRFAELDMWEQRAIAPPKELMNRKAVGD